MLLTDEEKQLIKKRCVEGYWDPIDGQYSSLDNSTPLGKCEGAIHEVAHGFVLGLQPHEIGSDHISMQIDKLEARAEKRWRKQAYEWNEIRTQAISILVLRAIGYAVTDNDVRALCRGAKDNMHEDGMFGTSQGIKKWITRLLETKKTARIARKVIAAMLGDDLPKE